MTATLTITHDPIDRFVTVVVDCELGTSTLAGAQSPAMPIPDEWLVLSALADHYENQCRNGCTCTAELWRKYGHAWKRAGLPYPSFGGAVDASPERPS